jgi:deoxycytidine triphosphate deaminase
MSDQTLLDFDIIYEARRHGLLVPFEEKQLKGASYDVRTGDYAILVHSEQEGGYERISLKERGYIDIAPNQTVAIYSLERLGVPPDMKGRLSLRSYWAIKGLHFNGGVVDPGYTGLLFFNVTNLGASTIRIAYGEGLVTTEFVRMNQPTQRIYNDGEPLLDIPEERLSPLPPPPSLDDLSELGKRVDQLARRLAALEKALKHKT